MKKKLKGFLAFLAILLGLAVLTTAGVVFVLPRFINASEDTSSEIEMPEKMEINESNGMLYMNNEAIIFIRQPVRQEAVAELFEAYEAQVDDSMADIGIYRLIFQESMEYDELEDLIEELKEDPNVEDAYLNLGIEFEEDAIDEEDDFEYKEPLYPNDPWKNDDWNVKVPAGKNWGMEAIDAPGAWGYLEKLNQVKVGLIDGIPNVEHEDLSFADAALFIIDEETGITDRMPLVNDGIGSADHGTHVAGTINANWDNNTGVSGVMGGKGELYYSAVCYKIDDEYIQKYATAYSYLLSLKSLINEDVQVINISQNTNRLLGFAASHGNKNAIDYLSRQAELTEKGLLRIIEDRKAAGRSDFVICVAAGNSNNIYYCRDEESPYGYREENTWDYLLRIFSLRKGEVGGSLALYNNFLNLMEEDEVKNRLIVVGAVGIDSDDSSPENTRYSYADFSNIGSRVDIVAPGVNIYSCAFDGYDYGSGTSMATPHVSGTAGLAFACNPQLSGPEVKEILIASSTGRYYHGDAYSGLLNANRTVINALKTVDTSVSRVLNTETDAGIDLCFVVDTTGSMGDDIDNARENMENILRHLAEKTENYRVALIDYRDFPDRSGEPSDYPYKVQLRFTDDNSVITSAIDNLDLGQGGDEEETVYSALMSAVDLDWRSDAKKVIIILGDAAPLDPEPETEYTYEQVLLALFNADISLDYQESDKRVVNTLDASLINVFSIGADASSDAATFFEAISSSTGGSYAGVDNADEVSDAIIGSIEQIEVDEKFDVYADFGDAMADQEISLYSDGAYIFTAKADENGQVVLEDMEADTYRWASDSLYKSGTIEVAADSRQVNVQLKEAYWFTPILLIWQKHAALICVGLAAYIAFCAIVPFSIYKIRKHRRK